MTEIVPYDLTKDYDEIKELMKELTGHLNQIFDERRFEGKFEVSHFPNLMLSLIS